MAKSTLNIGQELQSDSLIYRIEAVLGQGSFGITYKAKAFTTINNHIGYYWSGIKSKVLEFQPGNNTINQEDKPEIRENFATYCQLSIRPVKSRGVARYNLKE